MNATTLQPGQHYDPGYPVPDLKIGQRLAGSWTVIAAIRQTDRPGLLPGLHIVVAYDPANDATPYVTWEVAWQPFTERERIDRAVAKIAPDLPDAGPAALAIMARAALGEVPTGRWVASSGHYIWASGLAYDEAVADMVKRAHWSPQTPAEAEVAAEFAKLRTLEDRRDAIHSLATQLRTTGNHRAADVAEQLDTDPDQPERDLQEEAYNRAFCPACGTSPCESEDDHAAERAAECYAEAAADLDDQEA